MSKDSNFRVITGGEERKENDSDSDVALGLTLMTSFLLLSRERKLEVIQFVNRLASFPPSNGD